MIDATRQTSQRTLTDGRSLTLHAHMTAPNMVWVELRIDGQKVAGCAGFGVIPPAALKANPLLAERGFTHNIHARGVGNVPILPSEVEAWQAGRDALRAEVLANDPQARLEALVSARADLVSLIGSIQAAERDRADRAWERGDEIAAVVTPRSVRQELDDARQALGDFDAAHPEVVEHLRAERQAEVERFLAID